MREILFRGQTRKNGARLGLNGAFMPSKWVYGGIYQGEGERSIIYSDENDSIEKHSVYTSTVGQFTGLCDKHGKKIFEGDIIELVNADNETIHVICKFGTVRRPIFENTVDITGFYFELSNGRKTFPITNNYLGKHDLELFEVIGNIHDNPELLESSPC